MLAVFSDRTYCELGFFPLSRRGDASVEARPRVVGSSEGLGLKATTIPVSSYQCAAGFDHHADIAAPEEVRELLAIADPSEFPVTFG